MAKGVSVQVDGLDKLIKKMRSIPANIADAIDATLSAAAKGFEDRAVNDAPTDQGVLKNSITTKRIKHMDYEVVSGASWSAFIEFGTKRRAKIPADLAAYAAQFKGKKGGNNQGFYDSILAWVKRKGIAGTYNVQTRRREGSRVEQQIETEQIAFAIYLSILRHGVHAHPYFFKQMPIAQAEVNRDLKDVVEKALRK